MTRFKGKIAIGACGMGLASVDRLAREGAESYAIDICGDEAERRRFAASGSVT